MQTSRGIIPFLLFLLSLLASACSPATGSVIRPTTRVQPTSTSVKQVASPTAKPAQKTPTTGSNLPLPDADQVLFTIQNAESWSGKEGDSRPDWKGWGAETFSVAPDSTFWIADTAVFPNRLLHYNPQGELLDDISLEDKVVYAYDLLITPESIYVLDISTEQPKVIQFSLNGQVASEVDIDKRILQYEGEFIMPGVFNILLGEKGELLASGMGGTFELKNTIGELTYQPLEALSFYGHTYREGAYDITSGQKPVYVDGSELETTPGFIPEAEPFLGINPDGSFALAGYVPEPDYQRDHQVRYYDAMGKLIGVARQRPQTFYKDWNHHLAFGPDGAVYQLLSNPDHSVQVVRLGFSGELPQKPVLGLSTPVKLMPIQAYEPGETEEEQARNTLLAFFSYLSAGEYEQAAALFGGQMDDYLRDPLPGETDAAYWEYACAFLWCLPVAEITEVEKGSRDEFIFYTVFVQPDGTRFEIGACCGGDPAAFPPVWQFAFPVKNSGGTWQIMRAPLFTP
jgi:hypothetical protein